MNDAAVPTLSLAVLIAIPLAPLVGAVLAGFFGRVIGRVGAHTATILGVFIALVLSVVVFIDVAHGARLDQALYTWAHVGGIRGGIDFQVGSMSGLVRHELP